MILPNSFQYTLHLATIVFAISISIQNIEYIYLKKIWSSEGIWKLSNISAECTALTHPNLKKFWDIIWGPLFDFLIIARFIAGASLFVYPNLLGLLIILISTLAINFRCRGSFNGGSDMMTVITSTGLCFSWGFQNTPSVGSIGIIYIGVQSIFSYFIAGLIKIRKSSWRSGHALEAFLKCSVYEKQPDLLTSTFNNRYFLIAASWATIIFECLFPLSLFSNSLALIFIILAALFHFTNIYVFGLNRFFWAWAATWPCIVFCAQLVKH